MNRFPPKNILIPVDFTEPSLSALESAKALGSALGADLELVYVFDFAPNLSYEGADLSIPAEQMKQHRRLIERDLKRAAKDYPQDKIKIRIEEGSPSVVLSRMSRKKSGALIVMGTHGYAGVARALYGSVAENVVRSSALPVLTLHKESQLSVPRNILVPVNFTAYADEALKYALDLAKSSSATVSALFVADERSDLASSMTVLETHLEDVLGAKKAAGIKAIVRDGKPDRTILAEADAGRYDLIVLSAHKKPFWKDWVIGMTAERVLRHSTTPVLAVPTMVGKAKKKKEAEV
jgi:nucleotide-binding universal stress UspA family protein